MWLSGVAGVISTCGLPGWPLKRYRHDELLIKYCLLSLLLTKFLPHKTCLNKGPDHLSMKWAKYRIFVNKTRGS